MADRFYLLTAVWQSLQLQQKFLCCNCNATISYTTNVVKTRSVES